MDTREFREQTYSCTEVADQLGITYRMLDYWIRRGIITIHVEAQGSGSRRAMSAADVARLSRCLERVRRAQLIQEAWTSGDLWAAEE